MSVLKCKICGGDIELNDAKGIGTCLYCGSNTTFTKVSDEQKVSMYNRGNHFRLSGDFDEALVVYEQIIKEDDKDAEAHWCAALSRFGIEYVADPTTLEYLPTCHRASFDSFIDDIDVKAAIDNSDGITKRQYQKEALRIEEVRQGILATSSKEDPFDVFICYKETDQDGRRTQDSVLANDIYYALTQEGFRVFFSRITLEDKIGTAYEPYIFAALNSARVMVVIGTKPEYINSVWVKNEWGRYLSLVKESRGNKVLIPAYRDMDPYDLPEEFSHLQALDMSKLGFMQDLIRGVKKFSSAHVSNLVLSPGTQNEQVDNTEALVKRAFLFLEDGDYIKADEYCERVLDKDPENARAYLGKLMVNLEVRKKEELSDCKQSFDDNNYYKKAIRFGDDELRTVLRQYISDINERNENERINTIYENAVRKMKMAINETEYKDVIATFKEIGGWKDSDNLVALCLKRIDEIKTQKEAEQQEKKRRSEIHAEKRKKTISIAIPALVICGVIVCTFIFIIYPKIKMDKAFKLLKAEDYENAYTLLEDAGNIDAITENKCERVENMLNSGDLEGARVLLEEIRKLDLDGNPVLMDKYRGVQYLAATRFAEKNMVKDAYDLFLELGQYKDAEEKSKELNDVLVKAKIDALMEEKDYEEALEKAEKWETDDLTLKQELYNSIAYIQGQQYLKENKIDKAYEAFLLCSDYKDSKHYIKANSYNVAVSYMKRGELSKALEAIRYIDDSVVNKQHMMEICEEYRDISGIWKCTGGDVKHSDMFITESMFYTDIYVCVSIDVNTDDVSYYVGPTETTWFEKKEYVKEKNKLYHKDEYTAFVAKRKEGFGGEVKNGDTYEADVMEDYRFDIDSGRLTIRDIRKDKSGKGFADEIDITATFNRPE